MPVSHPQLYSIYLRKLHGLFATLGLAEDTWGLNSGAMSEHDFLDQAWAIHGERERMLFESLNCTRNGLIVCVFDGPDRIQHMFYRHEAKDHPANRDAPVSGEHSIIDEMYVRMDDLVGRVAAELKPDDVLIVLSDHGFCEFRRGVNLNAWLRDEGYLHLLPEAVPGDWFSGVDWSRTRAYAFGLNGVCLNLAGRESQGIVPPGESAWLKKEIQEKLAALVDPATGRRVIRGVYDAQTEYHGPYVGEAPDLIPGYEAGYRVSWESVSGRVEGKCFVDNTHRWSGDHCVDPTVVPGVLLTNRRIRRNQTPSLIDLAPTILNLFGVPVPAYMDGEAFEFESSRAPDESAGTTTSPSAHELQEA
jgi:predicted AlkP superfamily phosphohydrolase/phosphomutase